MAAQNGQKVFGSGRFYGTPLTGDVTPIPTLVPQDISINFKRDIKRLHGFNQFPVDVAAGMMQIVGKVTGAALSARQLNNLLMGGTMTTGQVPNIANETVTVTSGSTVATLANGAGFQADLGIYVTATGVPLAKVSTGVAVTSGNYSLTTAGALALSSLDAFTGLKASYLYSTVGGQSVALSNQPMGKVGGFQAVAAFLWNNEKSTVTLNNCIASDLEYATKLDDYMKPPFSFEAAADTNDNLGTMSFAEIT